MSSDEGLLILCVLVLLFVILYFIRISKMPTNPSVYVPVPEPYCLHSKYGCCPLSPNPRNDPYGTNC